MEFKSLIAKREPSKFVEINEPNVSFVDDKHSFNI